MVYTPGLPEKMYVIRANEHGSDQQAQLPNSFWFYQGGGSSLWCQRFGKRHDGLRITARPFHRTIIE